MKNKMKKYYYTLLMVIFTTFYFSPALFGQTAVDTPIKNIFTPLQIPTPC